MENRPENWDDIARLIALDKASGLDQLRRREFVPGALPTRRSAPAPESRPAMRRTVLALAASILFVAGWTSLWLLKGGWGSMASAPALTELLSESYFYNRAGNTEAVAPATVAKASVNPHFTRWIEAGLGHTAVEAEAVDPQAPVERGDPLKVRRKLSRMIREEALERVLTQFLRNS
jgi:hypothetical protein